jgi:hypothetical protein
VQGTDATHLGHSSGRREELEVRTARYEGPELVIGHLESSTSVILLAGCQQHRRSQVLCCCCWATRLQVRRPVARSGSGDAAAIPPPSLSHAVVARGGGGGGGARRRPTRAACILHRSWLVPSDRTALSDSWPAQIKDPQQHRIDQRGAEALLAAHTAPGGHPTPRGVAGCVALLGVVWIERRRRRRRHG